MPRKDMLGTRADFRTTAMGRRQKKRITERLSEFSECPDYSRPFGKAYQGTGSLI